ncbi:MAG TPA: hypothetical protein VGE07_22495 [Herpetosiphonaceae bacterium]
MKLSPISSSSRAGQAPPAARGPRLLADQRRLTLELLALVAALASLLDARLLGAWSAPAALDWAALGTHLLMAGMAMLLFREVWLIRWASRAGAPHPTYSDPWGRPLPWEVADRDE